MENSGNNKQKHDTSKLSKVPNTTQNGKLNERHVRPMLNRNAKPKKTRKINIFPTEIRTRRHLTRRYINKKTAHSFIVSFSKSILLFSMPQKADQIHCDQMQWHIIDIPLSKMPHSTCLCVCEFDSSKLSFM